MKVTVLGCGPSTGVPMIGNDWGACDPAEPRNARTRSSILIEHAGKTILVDAGPDLRVQLLAAKVSRIDAVIITHEHADHTQGIDDLRSFHHMTGRTLDLYALREALVTLKLRFDYMFKAHKTSPANLTGHEVVLDQGLPQFGITTFAQSHHNWISMGLRCGGFAYSTDVEALDDQAFAALQGIDTWIVAALRRHAHVAHAPLPTVLEWIVRAAPARAYLTHMNPTMDYRTLLAELPANVEPAYDGMVITIDD